ncbi:MAG TPA: RNA-guided pseudouridylation complex pseudouridine synthase subunit Cbf5 [Candidatus Thermoplasmatota archaeon]|jgi:H/ACA ribonucleoprotein complex subunit 4|nr:RNA-guided pseudouridylation complex pseudouridine synthase subunit Cbf5 [Candidatus Thermoplasmatota archaeon]
MAASVAQERRRLVRDQASTDASHGCAPDARPIREHLRLGAVPLDKPAGPTSHQVVAWIKSALDLPRAGHGGTLDPNVTGVLPVALADATRCVKALLLAPKEYVAVMRLHADVPRPRLEKVVQEFTGPIYQTPPLKSAVKKELRVRTIYAHELLELEGREALLRVRCEAGTYIRTLCTDMGTALGVGANMAALRRTRTARIGEEHLVTLHDLRDAWEWYKADGDEAELRRVVWPMERLLDHLPKVVLRDSAVDAICHGADLAVPGIAQLDEGIEPGQVVVLLSLKGEGVALGKALVGSRAMLEQEQGVALDTMRVLMDPGTYPKGW